MKEKKDKNAIKKERQGGTSVTIQIDVNKIVKYLCLTGAVVVGVIFGASVLKTRLKLGASSAVIFLERGKKVIE